MWIKVPVFVFREDPILIINLRESRFEEDVAVKLKQKFQSKRRCYFILIWVCLLLLCNAFLQYYLDQYMGISIPGNYVMMAVGYLSLIPLIYIFNKFLIYRSYLHSLKHGYPEL